MMMHRLPLVWLGMTALAFTATSPCTAQPPDPRFDEETGRDRRVWPPDVLVDYTRMRLTMEIPDMSTAAFRGVQELWFTGIGAPRTGLTIDCGPGLTVNSVHFVDASGGVRPCEFSRPATDKLAITFPEPFRVGAEGRLRIAYDARNPGGRGAGLTFSGDDRRTPEVDYMCHAQGQPQSNHLWFPCHDFPNDRLATELVVTVPHPYEAVSNGFIRSITHHPAADDLPRRVTYHWVQDAEHPFYLVTLIVSKFDVINLGGPTSSRPGLWIPVYGALGSGAALELNFANTPAMITHFEQLFDSPFPWDKYAQIICRDFAAGAMENTSASTFANMFGRRGASGFADGIIAHELVHQWFGDLVTCRSWEHLWLNEGWATFGEALWAEQQRGRRRYDGVIWEKFSSTISRTGGRSGPRDAALVSNLYRNPDQRFYAAENPYERGAIVLHMLRCRLGDDIFWKGVRLYLKRHRFNQVETDDFRVALEDASGESLERFFDQWVLRPGHPQLAVDLDWTDDERPNGETAGTLRIRVEQTQKIDEFNPAYAFVLPIWLDLPDAGRSGRTVHMVCDSRITSAEFALPRKPDSVTVDPGMTVLADTTIRQELAAWLRQLEHGPSVAARAAAAHALAAFDDDRARAALAEIAFGDLEDDAAVIAAATAALAEQPPVAATVP